MYDAAGRTSAEVKIYIDIEHSHILLKIDDGVAIL